MNWAIINEQQKSQFQPRINAPGWEDVIHITPAKTYTDEQKQYYREWYNICDYYNFDPIRLATANHWTTERAQLMIKDATEYHVNAQARYQRWLRIQESPTPEAVNDIGKIMTQIDNVDDALVTLGYIGRIAARRWPILKPVVGFVNKGRELADMMMLWGLFRSAGKEAKQDIEMALQKKGMFSKSGIKTLQRIGEYAPTWREFLQIAQTTDLLVGTGLCLGPIVGFIEDLTFGLVSVQQQVYQLYSDEAMGYTLWQKAGITPDQLAQMPADQQQKYFTDYNITPGPTWSWIGDTIKKAATWSLQFLYNSDLEQDLSTEDHIYLHAGWNLTAEFLRPLMSVIDPGIFTKGWLDKKIPGGPYGIHAGGKAETLNELFFDHAPIAAKALSGWIDKIEDPYVRLFCETMRDDTATKALEAMEGSPIEYNVVRDPNAQAAVLLIEYGLAPNLVDTRDRAEAAILAAGQAIEKDGAVKPPYQVIYNSVKHLIH